MDVFTFFCAEYLRRRRGLLNLMRGKKKKKKVLTLYLGFVSSGRYLCGARRSPRDANR